MWASAHIFKGTAHWQKPEAMSPKEDLAGANGHDAMPPFSDPWPLTVATQPSINAVSPPQPDAE